MSLRGPRARLREPSHNSNQVTPYQTLVELESVLGSIEFDSSSGRQTVLTSKVSGTLSFRVKSFYRITGSRRPSGSRPRIKGTIGVLWEPSLCQVSLDSYRPSRSWCRLYHTVYLFRGPRVSSIPRAPRSTGVGLGVQRYYHPLTTPTLSTLPDS